MVERVGHISLNMVVVALSACLLRHDNPENLEISLAQRLGGGRVLIDCIVKRGGLQIPQYTCGTGCLRRMGRMP